MRSLASELTRRGLKIAVNEPRSVQKVYTWLSELGLRSSVEVGADGVEVPDAVLRSDEPFVFACWLAMALAATRRVIIGVDLGTRHMGLAAVVGGMLAFSCVSRGFRRLLHATSVLTSLGAKVHVRIGYSSHLTGATEELRRNLEALGASVELLGNEQAKETVILGDFTKLGKLSNHELDALKIALAHDTSRLQSRSSASTRLD